MGVAIPAIRTAIDDINKANNGLTVPSAVVDGIGLVDDITKAAVGAVLAGTAVVKPIIDSALAGDYPTKGEMMDLINNAITATEDILKSIPNLPVDVLEAFNVVKRYLVQGLAMIAGKEASFVQSAILAAEDVANARILRMADGGTKFALGKLSFYAFPFIHTVVEPIVNKWPRPDKGEVLLAGIGAIKTVVVDISYEDNGITVPPFVLDSIRLVESVTAAALVPDASAKDVAKVTLNATGIVVASAVYDPLFNLPLLHRLSITHGYNIAAAMAIAALDCEPLEEILVVGISEVKKAAVSAAVQELGLPPMIVGALDHLEPLMRTLLQRIKSKIEAAKKPKKRRSIAAGPIRKAEVNPAGGHPQLSRINQKNDDNKDYFRLTYPDGADLFASAGASSGRRRRTVATQKQNKIHWEFSSNGTAYAFDMDLTPSYLEPGAVISFGGDTNNTLNAADLEPPTFQSADGKATVAIGSGGYIAGAIRTAAGELLSVHGKESNGGFVHWVEKAKTQGEACGTEPTNTATSEDAQTAPRKQRRAAYTAETWASDSHLDLGCARYWYVSYGVKYIDLVSLALFSG